MEQKDDIYQSIREIIEFLTPNEVSSTETKGKILCIPEQAIRDEVGVSILNQLLNLNSFDSQHTSILKLNEIFELIDKQNPDIFCIVAVAPIILSKMRFFCARIHQHKPQLPIVLCLLGVPKVDPEIIEKLHSIGSTKVVISLAEALDTLQKKL